MIVFVEALNAGVGPPDVPPADPGTVLLQEPCDDCRRFGEVRYVAPAVGCVLF